MPQLKTLKVGTPQIDGTVFAGVLSDGVTRMYTTPQDFEPKTFNSAASAIHWMNHNRDFGHSDWQMPNEEAARVLLANRRKGALSGTFKDAAAKGDYNHTAIESYYWMSTPDAELAGIMDNQRVRALRMHDGGIYIDLLENNKLSCRPVRLVR